MTSSATASADPVGSGSREKAHLDKLLLQAAIPARDPRQWTRWRALISQCVALFSVQEGLPNSNQLVQRARDVPIELWFTRRI